MFSGRINIVANREKAVGYLQNSALDRVGGYRGTHDSQPFESNSLVATRATEQKSDTENSSGSAGNA